MAKVFLETYPIQEKLNKTLKMVRKPAPKIPVLTEVMNLQSGEFTFPPVPCFPVWLMEMKPYNKRECSNIRCESLGNVLWHM